MNSRIRRRPLLFDSLEDRRLLAVFSPLPGVSDGEQGSLRAAIESTQSNGEDDTVNLGKGVYRLTRGDLRVDEQDSALRIVGAGRESTLILLADGSRFLDIDFETTVELSGVTVLRGSADEGGQVRSAGNLSVSESDFVGGSALQGGAIFNGGFLELTDVRFRRHQAGWGGALWNHAGAVVDARNVAFSANRVDQGSAAGVTSLQQLGVQGSLPVERNEVAFLLADSLDDPAGAAVFNAGLFFADQLELVENSSDSGAVFTNFGADASFDGTGLTAHDNDTGFQSVFTNVLGEAVITRSSFFHNAGGLGTIINGFGKLDVFATSVFENDLRLGSGWSGALLVHSGLTRLENVSIVRNNLNRDVRGYPGYNGVSAGLVVQNNEDSLLQMTGVVVEGNQRWDSRLIETSTGLGRADQPELNNGGIWGNYQLLGGNRIGAHLFLGHANKVPAGVQPGVTDVFLEPSQSRSDVQDQFQLLEPGIYDGIASVPPAASSRLIDVLPATALSIDGDGDGVVRADAGAVEFSPSLVRRGDLPRPRQADFTVQEDGPATALALDDELTQVMALFGTAELDQQGRVVYQGSADFFGTDELFLLSSDGGVNSVTIQVLPTPDPPVARDDRFVIVGVPEDPIVNPGQRLIPLHNDSPGADGGNGLQLIEFTQPEHGENVVIEFIPSITREYSGRDFVEYIPAPGFSGLDSFTYTVRNASGEVATATVTVEVLDPEAVPAYGEMRVQFVDAESQPIDRIGVGETFFAELEVENVTPLSNLVPDGLSGFRTAAAGLRVTGDDVAATGAYSPLGVILNRGDVEPEAVAPFTANENLTVVIQRNPSTVVAYVETSTPGAEDLATFFRIPLIADSAGQVKAEFDPGIGQDFVDATIIGGNSIGERVPYSQLLPYDTIPPDGIRFVGDTIEVIGDDSDSARDPQSSNTNRDLPQDVNVDGQVTANDALIIINALDRMAADGPSDETNSTTLQAAIDSDKYKWDVDQSGTLTAKDALRIINYLAVMTPDPPSQAETEFVPALRTSNDNQGDLSELRAASVSSIDRVFSQWDNQPNRPVPPAELAIEHPASSDLEEEAQQAIATETGQLIGESHWPKVQPIA